MGETRKKNEEKRNAYKILDRVFGS